jgi:nucleotide-binding universal stress UspA family protein
MAVEHGESESTIVVGTDGSDTAKRAVGEAVRLTKALGGEMHIVSGYTPLRGARVSGAPEGEARGLAPLPESKVNAILDEAGALARIAGAKAHTHAVPGDAADALLSVAQDVRASLIVVGSQGMHGAKRLLGSVPNKVSHHARCNVLIVATDQE